MSAHYGAVRTRELAPALAPCPWLTPDCWVTSDQHFGRGHEQAQALMRDRWCERVLEGDRLLHLGDLLDYPCEAAQGLPGRKAIVLGNGDAALGAWLAEQGWEVLGRGDKPLYWLAPGDELVALSHEPCPAERGFDINVHGHCHGARPFASYGPGLRADVGVHRWALAPVRLGAALVSARERGRPWPELS